ncbi:hypothetical protein RHGRI_035148 [Rhododendron griersonianum]|uniref:non-specific serine/threonine protein kinase n=1 Tax=Rhododendron griersonianum TaxID=479676 RepID=A0AAV6I818_9ERIC|nr:hypothetical protein RHGRI_035148 [Rhododendron griersonianum]
MFLFLLQHFFIILRHALSVNQNHHPLHHSLETDRAALLEFKRTIKSDPNSSLSNWNDSTHVCYFTGVRCNKEHHRVWQLNLNDSGIVGPLSPFISNLTHLRVLELVNNNLSGEIPQEFSSLRHLRLLLLGGNDIHGQIPDTFSLLVNLTVVDLGLNRLTGKIPPSFFSNCTSLKSVDLSFNQLSGEIPREFSSLRHLRHLLLEGNNLHGQIPDTFSLLVNLTVVDLRQNRLTGNLPPSFFSNCTLLKNVDLSFNFLEGNIPEIGSCQDLWNLNLYNNNFTGEIPFSITNATSMENLDVEYNFLSGELPSKIMESLPDLEFLYLSFNPMISAENNSNLDPFFTALCNSTSVVELELEGMGLGGKLPTSIGKCVYLESLLLQENNITGSIPPTLSNLTHLSQLNLTSNLLIGTIPEEISQLPRLQQLFLSHNLLSGPIPAAVGQFQLLRLLDLSNNKFSGEIPKSLGNLVKINYMFLNNNLLSGSIPSSLVQCRNLYTLDLSYNNLSGNIPPEITGLREMRIFINLSHNFLEGDLPIELSKLENVQEMDLSSNRFTGRVSPRISSCIALSLLNISNNRLEGELPESLGDLKNLEVLDVSVNHLFGTIPESLSNIRTLKFLNLSHNFLEGDLPIELCKLENVQEMDLSSNRLTGRVSPWISSCIALSLLNISHNRLEGKLPESLGDLCNLEVFDVSVNNLFGTIPTSLSNIRTLTFLNLSVNKFSGTIPSGGIFDSVTNSSFLQNKNLCGSILGIPSCPKSTKKLFHSTTFLIIFGIVISLSVAFFGVRYLKVVISAGKAEPETEPQPEWVDFFPRITYKELECQVLKSIRHRNLIRIITTCSLPDFKALVLPHMANGSLDSQLYPHSGTGLSTSGSSGLTLIQRVNICSDIAEGMAYLHHHSPVRVIHRDLNPSNVLLNDNMTALVSDFGIARLVMTVEGGNNCRFYENVEKSSTNRLCGSIGYIAPEYGLGSDASIKGDVYSFGIIVLEMVTRKRPTDDMFTGGLSLPRWVKNHYNGRIERVVDSSLVKAMRDQSPEEKKMCEVAIKELTELGILCTLDSPSTRPTMLDAADD